MILYIIIGGVGVVALAGLGVALYSIKLTHDEIRNRNRHLAERVDMTINRSTRIVR